MDKLFVFLGKYLFLKMKDFIPGIDPFTFAKHTCLSVLDITHAHEHIINNELNNVRAKMQLRCF